MSSGEDGPAVEIMTKMEMGDALDQARVLRRVSRFLLGTSQREQVQGKRPGSQSGKEEGPKGKKKNI